MDANKTRYHLLTGSQDWEALLAQVAFGEDAPHHQVAWDPAAQMVTLRPELFHFPASRPAFEQEQRRGAACDRFGNWYWIGPDRRELRVHRYGETQPERYWSPDQLRVERGPSQAGGFTSVEPGLPPEVSLRGLCVTGEQYLVVGVREPKGLLAFDLQAVGPPVWIGWPQGVDFDPLDLSPTFDGGLVLLSAGAEPRYWVLDRCLRVARTSENPTWVDPPGQDLFQPEKGEQRIRSGRSFPAGYSLKSKFGKERPIAIEAVQDGTVLILTSGNPSYLYRMRGAEYVGAGFALSTRVYEGEKGHDIPAYDFAYLPAPPGPDPKALGTVYVVAGDGNQAYAFDLTDDALNFRLSRRYLPMRRFSGKGLARSEETVYYDMDERWLPLVEQPRPRYAPEGWVKTPRLDGKQPDCVWHRVMLDAVIPPGAAVTVESRAGNHPDQLAGLPWQREPQPYLRRAGSELPYHQPFAAEECKAEGAGTWELLLQQAHGQYLELRLRLSGTGRNTPRIRALRVYYPRFSYLREYLPKAYQEDPASSSFLDRFLSNPEGLFTALEDRIAQAQFLMDVRTAPAEYLDWLAGWVGMLLDPAWEERRRRLFIAHAPELYRQRGTVDGLIRAIRLATDPCPDDRIFTEDVVPYRHGKASSEAALRAAARSVRIMEHFENRRLPAKGEPVRADRSRLSLLYRQFLERRYRTPEALSRAWERPVAGWGEIEFPAVQPPGEVEGADWLCCVEREMQGLYRPVSPSDRRAYQEFLVHRYRRIETLLAAYRFAMPRLAEGKTPFLKATALKPSKSTASMLPTFRLPLPKPVPIMEELPWAEAPKRFSEIALPERIPTGRQALNDWLSFVCYSLPLTRSAHRFTVLVPTRVGASGDRSIDPEVVRQIVETEKPAHTEFTIKEFWALFRVGEAQLGLDTILDQGSRYAAFVLGRTKLAEGFLAYSHPWDVLGRTVVGRDAVIADDEVGLRLQAKGEEP